MSLGKMPICGVNETEAEMPCRPLRYFNLLALRQSLDAIGDDEWWLERSDEENGVIRYEIYSRRDGFILGMDDDLTPRAQLIAGLIVGAKNEMRSLLDRTPAVTVAEEDPVDGRGRNNNSTRTGRRFSDGVRVRRNRRR